MRPGIKIKPTKEIRPVGRDYMLTPEKQYLIVSQYTSKMSYSWVGLLGYPQILFRADLFKIVKEPTNA